MVLPQLSGSSQAALYRLVHPSEGLTSLQDLQNVVRRKQIQNVKKLSGLLEVAWQFEEGIV